jgi:hypothetical protein
MRSPFVISLLIIVLSLNLAFAQVGVEKEFLTDKNGNLLLRYLTPGTPGLLSEISLPFTPPADQSVLWCVEHPTAIANNVDLNGLGDYLIAGWYLNVERVSKYAIQGTGAPIWEYSVAPNFYAPVSSSDDGNVISACGDIIPLMTWLNGAGPTPSWTYTQPAGFNWSDCNVSDDGAHIAAVCLLSGGSEGRLYYFNSTSATPIWMISFDGQNGINGVEISEDNNWILVTTYYHFYVFNLASYTLFFTGSNYSQTQGGIDDDATYLATGDFYGQLKVYQRNATGYTQIWSNTMGGWVTAVDISSDASKVLAGNFTYSPTYAGKVRAFNIGGTQLWEYAQYGDYVSSVALCNDGSTGVASSWGQLDATFGDVFTAFDINTGAVILRLLDDLDEPGSIFDVAISNDGSYAVCGGKSVHARTFGNGGEVYSIELALPGPFNVTVDLTPDTLHIYIPANGGSFGFNIQITNNEISPVTFDVWTEVLLPSGFTYGPILNRTLTLPAGNSVSRHLTQSIPANAPSGDYQYIAKVGNAPNDPWSQDSFPFTKIGWQEGSSGGSWILSNTIEPPDSNK